MAAFWDQGFSESPSTSQPLSRVGYSGQVDPRTVTSLQPVTSSGLIDPYAPQLSTANVYWNQLNSGNPWETVIIGGMPLPGISFPRATPGKRVQKAKSPGVNGASHIVQGYDPSDVDIDVRMWTPSQLKAFNAMMAVLWPVVGKEPVINLAGGQAVNIIGVATGQLLGTLPTPLQTGKKPLATKDYFKAVWSIQHPALEHLHISRVTVISVSSLEPAETGVFTCHIKCWEWVKPDKKPANGKAKAEVDQTEAGHRGADPSPGTGAANSSTQPPPSMSVQP